MNSIIPSVNNILFFLTSQVKSQTKIAFRFFFQKNWKQALEQNINTSQNVFSMFFTASTTKPNWHYSETQFYIATNSTHLWEFIAMKKNVLIRDVRTDRNRAAQTKQSPAHSRSSSRTKCSKLSCSNFGQMERPSSNCQLVAGYRPPMTATWSAALSPTLHCVVVQCTIGPNKPLSGIRYKRLGQAKGLECPILQYVCIYWDIL